MSRRKSKVSIKAEDDSAFYGSINKRGTGYSAVFLATLATELYRHGTDMVEEQIKLTKWYGYHLTILKSMGSTWEWPALGKEAVYKVETNPRRTGSGVW